MLHKLFEDGDWFLPKRYGYGAGLPIAWQGWVLILFYSLLVIGTAYGITNADPQAQWGGAALIAVATLLLVSIIHSRTRGEWRWRWGEED